MKQLFSVWQTNKTKKKQLFKLALDFERNTINLHKLKKGKEIRRRFRFSDCATLETSPTDTTILTIGFQTPDAFKKAFMFQSREQRELFVQLVQAVLITGSAAWMRFSELDVEGSGQLSWETLQQVGFAPTDAERPQEGTIDFIHFLIMISKGPSRGIALSNVAGGATGDGPASSARKSRNRIQLELQVLCGEAIMTEQEQTIRSDKNTPSGAILARGVFYLTNYRIVYRDYHDSVYNVDTPLGTLHRVVISPTDGLSIVLTTKNYQEYTMRFDRDARWVQSLGKDMIQSMAFSKDQTRSFAFSHTLPLPVSEVVDGWKIYDETAEYKRCGLLSSSFLRVVDNSKFDMCSTYPRKIVIPASITDKQLQDVCEFRCRARIPAVVWRHPVHNATLSRCAQPLVGIRNKRCEADEQMFQVLRTSNPSNSEVLYIIDARPYKAAVGNTVMGKGFEDCSRYDKCKIQFMGIDNIHHIRTAMEKTHEICQQALLPTFEEATWLPQLAQTQWLHYVRLVLHAGTIIAAMLDEEKASVVTHCSDGWDRTAQLSSLAQLLLDPYFRTLAGFAALIEKEWLSFGHKFTERYGHMDPSAENQQRAPIFHQFIDVVWQITRQFPLAFQFNEVFLLDILHHTTSCRFGTFLFECEKEREQAKVRERSQSLWTFLLAKPNRGRYHNTFYSPLLTNHRLIPATGARSIHLWEAFFLQYDETISRQPQSTSFVGHHLVTFQERYLRLRQACEEKGYDLSELDPEGGTNTALENLSKYDRPDVGAATPKACEEDKHV